MSANKENEKFEQDLIHLRIFRSDQNGQLMISFHVRDKAPPEIIDEMIKLLQTAKNRINAARSPHKDQNEMER